MIKRLIFDVDWTLIVGVDFRPTAEKALKRIGLYSEDNLNKFMIAVETYEEHYDNYNKKDYLTYLSSFLGKELSDNVLDIFFDELKFCISEPNNEKLINTISELSKEYELVLLTNYFKESQMNRLNNMQIGKYFKECYGEELIKPNRMAYINACGENKPEECIMIGDNIELDIKCAQKSGLNTIFVNSRKINIDEEDFATVRSVEEISKEFINNNFNKQMILYNDANNGEN